MPVMLIMPWPIGREASSSAEPETGKESSQSSGLSLCVTGDSGVTGVSEILPSLLDTLWSTRPLGLARKQKVHTNWWEETIPGWHQRWEKHLRRQTFFKAYWECLALKRNVVVSHMKCAKHQKSKEKLPKKEARERGLARAIEQQDVQTHRWGETLTGCTEYVMALMQAEKSLAKLECQGLRNLLQ